MIKRGRIVWLSVSVVLAALFLVQLWGCGAVVEVETAAPESVTAAVPEKPAPRSVTADVPGLLAELFNWGEWIENLPELGARKPDGAVLLPSLDIAVGGGAFPGTEVKEYLVARIRGVLKVEQSGAYRFILECDDGARVHIDGEKVVEDDGLHGMREREGEITLAAGRHPIDVLYFENAGGLGLRLSWVPPGGEKQVIPGEAFSHQQDQETEALLKAGEKLGRAAVVKEDKAPRAVSTFHSIGLTLPYQEDADAERSGKVRYRKKGSETWREGHPLYNDQDDREFRGSLVLLEPGTTYKIALSVEDELGLATSMLQIEAATWSEDFPIGKTVWIEPGVHKEPLKITRSGSASGYLLYSARPGREKETVVDVDGEHDNNATITGRYVIVRGLTLKNARRHAVLIRRGHHVVVERCTITGWGREGGFRKPGELDSGVFGGGSVSQIIVQDNVITTPRGCSNDWSEGHPSGPQAVSFLQTEGNHVIRYNELTSNDEHRYNDTIGGGWNGDIKGSTHRDTDIYGNLVSHCYDDGIESEGGNINVRIWGNKTEKTFTGIALVPVIKGPCYVWGNVIMDFDGVGFKLGDLGGKGHGAFYIYHTTIYHDKPHPGLGGWGGHMRKTTVRNNIVWCASEGGTSIDCGQDATNTFDYDMLQRTAKSAGDRHEKHRVRGDPAFVDAGARNFLLREESAAIDSGMEIPGFNDGFRGKAPDLGAFEFGAPPPHYGPRP